MDVPISTRSPLLRTTYLPDRSSSNIPTLPWSSAATSTHRLRPWRTLVPTSRLWTRCSQRHLPRTPTTASPAAGTSHAHWLSRRPSTARRPPPRPPNRPPFLPPGHLGYPKVQQPVDHHTDRPRAVRAA